MQPYKILLLYLEEKATEINDDLKLLFKERNIF